jgi:hypothetical protein
MCADLVNQLNKGFVHIEQSAMHFAAHGADPDKMRVVPDGVPPSRAAPDLAAAKVALGLKADSTFITSFGFLEPQKGVLEIIEALPEIPKAIFAFVGARNKGNSNSQACLNACRLRALQLGISERVVFPNGFLSATDATNLLQASDVIVMNHIINRNEISGAATFVLAHERPVVTSATPAFKQLTDCTFQISDEVGIARAVNLVLGNPRLARHLIQRGRAYARDNSYEVLARILLAEYGFLDDGDGSTQGPSTEMRDPQTPARAGLWEIFHDQLDCPSTKWSHYFGIYEGHIAALRDKPISLLEIGIYKGGSLTLWRKYFTQAAIFGADIDPACLKHQREGVRVFIGNQADPAFLNSLVLETGDLDIVIDDGGAPDAAADRLLHDPLPASQGGRRLHHRGPPHLLPCRLPSWASAAGHSHGAPQGAGGLPQLVVLQGKRRLDGLPLGIRPFLRQRLCACEEGT